jgi:hypothetical protein
LSLHARCKSCHPTSNYVPLLCISCCITCRALSIYNFCLIICYTWPCHIPPCTGPVRYPPQIQILNHYFQQRCLTANPYALPERCIGKRRSKVFLDNRGFLDQSHKLDLILHNTKGGPILCKRKHPAPQLDDVDACFEAHYDKACHGEQLRSDLDLYHLVPPIRDHVYNLLQKYWSVFDDKGLFIPVKDYKCSIDTGSARPICVTKINYALGGIPIMNQ